MTKETEKAEMKANEDGKVELQEEQLDEAQGGILIGLNQPVSNSLFKLTPTPGHKIGEGGNIFKLTGDGSVLKF